MKKASKTLHIIVFCFLSIFANIAFAAPMDGIQGTGASSKPAYLTFTKNADSGWSGTYTSAGGPGVMQVSRPIGNISDSNFQAGRIALMDNQMSPYTSMDGNQVVITNQNNIDYFANSVARNTYPGNTPADIANQGELTNRLSGKVAPGTGTQDPLAAAVNNVGSNLTGGAIDNLGDSAIGNPGDSPTKQGEPSIIEKGGNFFLYILSYSFYITTILLGFLIDLSSKFIDFSYNAMYIASSATVKAGWTFTRDMLNFVFILILLAISFSTIAGLETFNRKLLPRLLFAALLVNFSLAIGAAFLQVSNVMTATIVKSVMPANTAEKCKGPGENIGCRLAIGLTTAGSVGDLYTFDNASWFSSFGLKTFSTSNNGITLENVSTKSFTDFLSIIVKSAMATIMVGVFAVAFIFLGVLMFVRIIALAILFILAPIPYVFPLIPKAQKYADEWWSKFINYVFFLPVVTFFLALAIRMLQRNGDPKKTSLISEFWGKSQGNAGLFASVTGSLVDVVFISIFIFAAVYVARTLSIFGATGALKTAKGAVLGASRLGALPARLVGSGAKAAAGGVAGYAARSSGAAGLYSGVKEGWATRMASRANAVKTGRAAQLGAGLTGGAAASGAIFAKQMADKQKDMKSDDTAALEKKAVLGGAEGAAATMELLERDKLGKGKINEDVIKRLAGNPAAQEKLKKAWIRKDPVTAIQKTSKPEDQAKDLATAIRKMKPDEIRDVDAEDFKRALEITNKAGEGLIFNQGHVRAVAESSNGKLAKVISEEVAKLEKQTDFNPGRDAVIAAAKKSGLRGRSGANQPGPGIVGPSRT